MWNLCDRFILYDIIVISTYILFYFHYYILTKSCSIDGSNNAEKEVKEEAEQPEEQKHKDKSMHEDKLLPKTHVQPTQQSGSSIIIFINPFDYYAKGSNKHLLYISRSNL
jgi:hypothetical protein